MSGELYTFQDFEKAANKADFIAAAISKHKNTQQYKMAVEADAYDRQENTTINQYVKTIFTLAGQQVQNYTASNAKIASNFFHRLNTQRCMYSLGKGVSFISAGESGADVTKEKLGQHFDHDIQNAAYKALIHGVSFCFWNMDHLYCFPLTEFVPFWDEYDGTLKAGARFWQLGPQYPMVVVLYEIDGYTRYESHDDSKINLQEVEPKRAYREKVAVLPLDMSEEIVGVENYSNLPIVPLWGSKLHQSTLIGMQQSIDSYDLIRSGFANDLTDCAQIYWIIENAGGMTEEDLAEFRDKLLYNHIAKVDSGSGSKATPFVQDIPFQARQAYLEAIRNEIYESFGALDVHTVAAGATNDHIDAAYQPMDEEAADFEYQLSDCIMQILSLIGIDDTPVFKRNRISNQMEQTEMVIAESPWLDRETILRKLPNIQPDEVQAILDRASYEEAGRFESSVSVTEDGTIRDDEEFESPLRDVSKSSSMLNVIQKINKGLITKEQALKVIDAATDLSREEIERLLAGTE